MKREKSQYVCKLCGHAVHCWFYGWKHAIGGYNPKPTCGGKPIPVKRTESKMNKTVETLYYLAIEAEKAFTDALIKEYGNRALDMRYIPNYKQPEHIQEASRAKREAFNAYRLAAFGR